ncbi:hypothetical protein SLE2022_126820 [Rubroshorea leprosula]
MAEVNRRRVGGDLAGLGWADLPTDLIGKIIEKLSWVDRIRLPAVCKSWTAVRGLALDAPDLPWMLKFRTEGTLFEMFDPCEKKKYVSDKWIEGNDKGIFADATIRCSRLGWLLLRSRTRDHSDPRSYIVSTFLFSPFTGEVIKLPKLEQDYYFNNVATFSMNSTSPECIVFIFWRTCYTAGFSTYRLGDKAWKTSKLDDARYQSYNLCPIDATYVAGSFYCLFADGDVGVLDTALQQWNLLEQCGPKLSDANRYRPPKFLTSDTDLRLFKYGNPLGGHIWKYDFSEKYWLHEQSYSSQEIFICSGLAVQDAGGEASGLVNKRFEAFDGESIKPAKGGMFAEFYEWLPKDNMSEEVQKIWFDQRLVWRKQDLLKPSKVAYPFI